MNRVRFPVSAISLSGFWESGKGKKYNTSSFLLPILSTNELSKGIWKHSRPSMPLKNKLKLTATTFSVFNFAVALKIYAKLAKLWSHKNNFVQEMTRKSLDNNPFVQSTLHPQNLHANCTYCNSKVSNIFPATSLCCYSSSITKLGPQEGVSPSQCLHDIQWHGGGNWGMQETKTLKAMNLVRKTETYSWIQFWEIIQTNFCFP